jgi:Predicted membrane protein
LDSQYISYLPHLNACLNATSAVLLLSGYSFIRARNVAAHRACQIAAFVVSLLFLTSYLIYHYNHGSTRFQGQGIVRPIYFTILTTHTILAVVIVPLIIITLYRAASGLRATSPHRADHFAAVALRVDHGSDRLSYALPDLSFLK